LFFWPFFGLGFSPSRSSTLISPRAAEISASKELSMEGAAARGRSAEGEGGVGDAGWKASGEAEAGPLVGSVVMGVIEKSRAERPRRGFVRGDSVPAPDGRCIRLAGNPAESGRFATPSWGSAHATVLRSRPDHPSGSPPSNSSESGSGRPRMDFCSSSELSATVSPSTLAARFGPLTDPRFRHGRMETHLLRQASA
jgi:hypothetical protein